MAQILKTVGLGPATFTAHLSFVKDGEFNIRPILDNFDGFASPGEEFGHDAASSDSLDETISGTPSEDRPLPNITLSLIEGDFTPG